INGPSSITLSGDENILKIIETKLKEKEIFAKFLNVLVPYHSEKMEAIKDELLQCLKDIKPRRAQLPLYLTGREGLATGLELDANYWWENLRNTVHFFPALTNMARDGYSLFLEVGPQPVLS